MEVRLRGREWQVVGSHRSGRIIPQLRCVRFCLHEAARAKGSPDAGVRCAAVCGAAALRHHRSMIADRSRRAAPRSSFTLVLTSNSSPFLGSFGFDSSWGRGAPDQARPWRGHRSCLSLAFKLRFTRRERCHAARAQVASVQLWAWTSLVARSVMAAYTPACAHERGRHLQSDGT